MQLEEVEDESQGIEGRDVLEIDGGLVEVDNDPLDIDDVEEEDCPPFAYIIGEMDPVQWSSKNIEVRFVASERMAAMLQLSHKGVGVRWCSLERYNEIVTKTDQKILQHWALTARLDSMEDKSHPVTPPVFCIGPVKSKKEWREEMARKRRLPRPAVLSKSKIVSRLCKAATGRPQLEQKQNRPKRTFQLQPGETLPAYAKYLLSEVVVETVETLEPIAEVSEEPKTQEDTCAMEEDMGKSNSESPPPPSPLSCVPESDLDSGSEHQTCEN